MKEMPFACVFYSISNMRKSFPFQGGSINLSFMDGGRLQINPIQAKPLKKEVFLSWIRDRDTPTHRAAV